MFILKKEQQSKIIKNYHLKSINSLRKSGTLSYDI